MTFCLGIKVQEGLVAIADTRITTGSECIQAKKISLHQHGKHSMFLMTSGLRSVRDKALTYFQETIDNEDASFDKLYKAVNAFGKQVRRVAEEDNESLKESGLEFNLHALIGGQLEHDKEHKLFLLYPQGNWVEIGQGTPYHIIGSARYGKPILDRSLTYQSSMEFAFKVGYLAFDATFTSAVDVSFPIDVALYRHDTYDIVEQRFDKEDFRTAAIWWQEHIVNAIDKLPMSHAETVFSQSLQQPVRTRSQALASTKAASQVAFQAVSKKAHKTHKSHPSKKVKKK